MKMKMFVFQTIAFFVSVSAFAQVVNTTYLDKVMLQTENEGFSTAKDTVNVQGRSSLYFQYTKDNEICNVKVFPSVGYKLKRLALAESADYNLLDSVVDYNGQYYTFTVQFRHLSASSFVRFRFILGSDSGRVIQDVPLLPVTTTTLVPDVPEPELTVGEEKVCELISNHPENIRFDPNWQKEQDVEYRIAELNGKLFLHLLAHAVGSKTLAIQLGTFVPQFVNGKLSYTLPVISQTLTVKKAPLAVLKPDKNDFILDDDLKNKGTEIYLDNAKNLQLNNTYLVESKEAVGSPLIAQIFTKERLSNNRILCLLRAYNYHTTSQGYLYVKDNDVARFVTNFNIIPQIAIEHIRVMRNGKDWQDEATIYPGETVDVKLEGKSLDKGRFRFDGVANLSVDSVTHSDHSLEYKLKVPLDISKKTVEIYNGGTKTGSVLNVKEYAKAHPFDYISINYGAGNKRLSDIHGPELYDKLIKDVVISFQPDKIDSVGSLFGKQYLTVEVKILGKKDEIVDQVTIDDIAICPGAKSPRYTFYDKADCKNSEISVNSKISNTTYNLSDWSKIKLTFKNQKDKYSQETQEKTVEIVLQRHTDFDINVSFPTGLLVKKMNTKGLGNFGGVSMSVLGEFSFYKQGKINKLQPFKIGAGFLALNTFDFSSDNSSRDLGAVVLGTLSPINTDRKFTFSIYLGGGYLFSAKTMFWLIGPGISVQF
jgi:hypothetical protein